MRKKCRQMWNISDSSLLCVISTHYRDRELEEQEGVILVDWLLPEKVKCVNWLKKSAKISMMSSVVE